MDVSFPVISIIILLWSRNNFLGLERQSHRHRYILTHVRVCVHSWYHRVLEELTRIYKIKYCQNMHKNYDTGQRK